MTGSIIVNGARTPIGKLAGASRDSARPTSAASLFAVALARAGVVGDQVDYVYMGQVLVGGAGQAPGTSSRRQRRHTDDDAIGAHQQGVSSGINAIYLADQMIRRGEADIVVAGGMESMTNSPYLLMKARGGYRFGDDTIHDSMIHDGLFCAFEHCAMGEGTERYAASAGIAREAPRRARGSVARACRAVHRRTACSTTSWSLSQFRSVEVTRSSSPSTKVCGPTRRPRASPGSRRVHQSRQHHGRQRVADLRRRGRSHRCVESGSRPPRARTARRGGRLRQVAGPDPSLLSQPSSYRPRRIQGGKTVHDIDLFEINEAFAAVAVASMHDLGITADVCNVNGGAIALGHPIGMSGTRIVLTLALELRRRGGGLGAAALCGGGGQGDALLLRSL